MASFMCVLPKLVLLLVYVVAANSFSPLHSSSCHDGERTALLQFKESLLIHDSASVYIGAYPKVSSWKPEEGKNQNCCSWDGVECDEMTGNVIGLDLSSSCLYGSINSSSSLFRLVHLQRLNLADNNFNYSRIPTGIRSFPMLSHLNLSYSAFFGEVPSEVSYLSKLSSLDLSLNVGNIRESNFRSLVQNLTRLEKLHLSPINISSSIPDTMANLSLLSSLLLPGCGLFGEFPVAIWKLQNLETLDLSDNNFTGGSLFGIGKQTKLTYLRLKNINLSGYIPSTLQNLTQLSYLTLRENQLTGLIPSWIGNLSSLTYIDLALNRLHGPIPDSLNFVQLTLLDLSDNNFTGGSLFWIGKQTRLAYLYLGNINLSGYIPSTLQNLTQLSYLTLRENQLTGLIPSWIGNLSSLTYIDLALNRLHGPIPDSLNFVQLTSLDLSGNNFIGGSLFWIGKQTKLTYLRLENINLSGYIPSTLQNLTLLSYLNLFENQLTGLIPSWIGNLSSLAYIELSRNRLHGPIPDSLFSLIDLQTLALQTNSLRGTVEILKLRSVTVLELSDNKLDVFTESGITNATFPKFSLLGLRSCNIKEFPYFLRYQQNLIYLDLSGNKLQGHVPKWLWNMSTETLEVMEVSENFLSRFEEPVPSVLPWVNLQVLLLGSNKLQGPLPIPHPKILQYDISDNEISGELSPLICSLNNIQFLDLGNNRLSGTLPQCLGNFSDDLQVLDLRNNSFHGILPQTYSTTSKLGMVSVSDNKLQGDLPRSLANCVRLEFLDLSNNKFRDVFPFWLGALEELKLLAVNHNAFYGLIGTPEKKLHFPFPKLRILDLSYNNFTGDFPSKYIFFGNSMRGINLNQSTYMDTDIETPSSPASGTYTIAPSFRYLFGATITSKGVGRYYSHIQEDFAAVDLSSNRFEGKIPDFIGNLTGLRSLNISNNNFTGHIPPSLGNLTLLDSLDLSQNKLSGEIPQQLTQIPSLGTFKVSNNSLTGPIPHGQQFNTFDSSSYEGNPGLCGDPMPKKCGDPKAPQPPPSTETENDSDSGVEVDWRFVLAGSVSGFLVGVVLADVLITKRPESFIKIVGTCRKFVEAPQRPRKQKRRHIIR